MTLGPRTPFRPPQSLEHMSFLNGWGECNALTCYGRLMGGTLDRARVRGWLNVATPIVLGWAGHQARQGEAADWWDSPRHVVAALEPKFRCSGMRQQGQPTATAVQSPPAPILQDRRHRDLPDQMTSSPPCFLIPWQNPALHDAREIPGGLPLMAPTGLERHHGTSLGLRDPGLGATRLHDAWWHRRL